MKIKKYLPIIGIAIFIYLLFKLDIASVFNEIKNANPSFILMTVFFTFVSFFTSTIKWYAIARKQNMNLPFFYAFKVNLIAIFYGFVTPSRIGSIARVEYLRRFNGDKVGKAVSNYVLDKMLDFCSLFILVIISGFLLKNILPATHVKYAVAGLLAIFVFALVFKEKERTRFFLKLFYIKILPKKIKETVKEGFDSFYEDMPEKKYFVLFVFLNLLNWIAIYSTSFFAGLSIGLNVSFIYFLLFMPAVTLIGQIPITISGLGTREAAMISLFGLLGISATKIFSMSLINLVINGIFPAIIGMLLILENKKNYGRKSQHSDACP